MERQIKKDDRYRNVLLVTQIIYILFGIGIAVVGILYHSAYTALNAMGTLLFVPALALVRHFCRIQGGYQLETYLYFFTFLSWTLGGAGSVYGLLPGYDKVVHCLSGLFVSIFALALYRILEGKHSREGENPATACVFVFAASMAVAGIFELIEYTLAPIMGRDLQHVQDTGVGDTMQDMLVCLVGTIVFIFLMIRNIHGKHDPFTDSAEVFAWRNSGERRKIFLSGKNQKANAVSAEEEEKGCSKV